MNYSSFKYIYPPRPENKLPSSSLSFFDDMNRFDAEVKLNGSSMMIYTDGNKLYTYNRLKKTMIHKMNSGELVDLHRGRYKYWNVFCGEYMNKNQTDEIGEPWNLKYVIFDILVYNGEHLLKTTFDERYELLRDLYPDNTVKKYMHQISENCFRTEKIKTRFKDVFDDIIQYKMYEGLILKRRNGKLEDGFGIKNNTLTQFKCRKPTKNYNY